MATSLTTNVYGDYDLIATLTTEEEVNQFMETQLKNLLKKEKAKTTLKKKKVVSKKKVKLPKAKPKPTLPVTFISYGAIDYADLENVVQEFYGFKDYNFTELEACGNDSSHSFEVGKNIIDSDQIDIDKIRKGEKPKYLSNYLLLNALCQDKVIMPGNYLVEVCW